MAFLPSRRIKKVVNYAALDQDTDISDEDEFTGFSTSNKIKAKKPKDAVASPCNEEVAATRGKLQNKKISKSISLAGNCSDACSEGDDALESSSGSGTGRSSLQDRVFQRDLAAALELSKKTSRLDRDLTVDEIASPPQDTTAPCEVSSGSDQKDVLRDLTSEKLSGVDPGNCEEESQKFNPRQLSLSSMNKENVIEKENISSYAKPAMTPKESKKKLNVIDSDDDFSPVAAPKSFEMSESAASPLKDGSSAGCKRRIEATQKGVEVLTTGRSKRSCRKVSFAPDSSSDSENEWAESGEEDVDDLSENSDYEEGTPKAKKSKKETKPPRATKSASRMKSNCVDPKGVKPSLKTNEPIEAADRLPISTSVASSGENLTPESENKTEKPSSASRSKIQHKPIDANSLMSNTSPVSKARAALSVSEVTPVPKPSSPSPRPRLARATFKSPAGTVASQCPNSLIKTVAPSGGLRLGLSRRVSVKSLHPNASLK